MYNPGEKQEAVFDGSPAHADLALLDGYMILDYHVLHVSCSFDSPQSVPPRREAGGGV